MVHGQWGCRLLVLYAHSSHRALKNKQHHTDPQCKCTNAAVYEKLTAKVTVPTVHVKQTKLCGVTVYQNDFKSRIFFFFGGGGFILFIVFYFMSFTVVWVLVTCDLNIVITNLIQDSSMSCCRCWWLWAGSISCITAGLKTLCCCKPTHEEDARGCP